jgi:hypothetical protein
MELQLSKLIRGIAALPVLAFVWAAGCVSLDSFLTGKEQPPTGPVSAVMAFWNNEVDYAPDPTHNGQPNPGLVGRVYLLGPTMDLPLACEGGLVVDLYDETHVPMMQQKLPLEEWRIDKDTLQRLLRRDHIGWGYTVFLPWGTYRPEIGQVGLKVRFEPVHATPVYTDSSLTIHKTGVAQRSGQVIPGHPAEGQPKEMAIQ